ncbi:MAG: hypothetical protein IPN68_08705 [Bacteroidetes bacterium]|nr:hypothetical protein [Bacteroidota bacterium]
MLYNGNNDLPVYTGVRYIPQINYEIALKNNNSIDFEASLNINGSAGINPFDSLHTSGTIKPYRFWARYSTKQFELRAGLQKLNFGSALMMRPLMWFDEVDPRDPLKLTDGVWGILGRYYFLNNANIWFWGLYGNNDPRGWEFAGTKSNYPELGGRIQVPVPKGEAALSYNYRIADTRNSGLPIPQYNIVNENRVGFDIKLDMVTGLWFEGSWVNKNKDLGTYTNQEIFNAGIDYTFGLGNGLYIAYEQLLAVYDEDAFRFKNTNSFSLFTISYPVGLFDNISGIVYYDWKNNKTYNFINWQKQFNNLSLFLIGFWNPNIYKIPLQGEGENLFAGRGIQIMLVLNH